MKKIFFFTLVIISFLFGNEVEVDTFIEVSLSQKTFWAYNNGELIKSGPVLGGKRGYRTPKGVFRIYRKSKNHRSSKYPRPMGGAKMPFAMFLQNAKTWRKTGIAFHQGSLKGAGSHGCIRLNMSDARWLYRTYKVGTLVFIE
jgi:lipoprotein-anchoring transpeptidase ErfK/SrfK